MTTMRKMFGALCFVAAVAAGGGCDAKPSGGDCRAAVLKIRELIGTNRVQEAANIEAAVRSCRGGASKESVKCAKEANNLEALQKCGFLPEEDIADLLAEEAERKKKEAGVGTPDAAPAPTPSGVDSGTPSGPPSGVDGGVVTPGNPATANPATPSGVDAGAGAGTAGGAADAGPAKAGAAPGTGTGTAHPAPIRGTEPNTK